jgi:tRNA pseudouridine55 synthase
MAGRKEGQTDTVKEDPTQPEEQPTKWKKLPTSKDAVNSTEGEAGPPAFVLEMTVSSGTYVRSIVHDLAIAAGSEAHVQTLTRTRQGEWSIDSSPAHAQSDAKQIVPGNCIEWKLFADAIADMQREKSDASYRSPRDDDGLRAWERLLLNTIVPV